MTPISAETDGRDRIAELARSLYDRGYGCGASGNVSGVLEGPTGDHGRTNASATSGGTVAICASGRETNQAAPAKRTSASARIDRMSGLRVMRGYPFAKGRRAPRWQEMT